jgi:hypothetical protein
MSRIGTHVDQIGGWNQLIGKELHRIENTTHRQEAMMGASAVKDHDKIREWIEARGGHPARMKSGLVGVDFGNPISALEDDISWDEFFRIFDENRETFLHHDDKARRH